MINQDYYNEKVQEMKNEVGDKVEEVFEALMLRHGFTVRKATVKEDKEHIDYFLSRKGWKGEKKIDVKARKKVARYCKWFMDEQVWVEVQNVHGFEGWLYGKEDWLAFERPDDFVIVSRKKLLKITEKVTDMNSLVFSPFKAHDKLYKRKDGNDRCTRLKMTDLLSIPHTIIKK